METPTKQLEMDLGMTNFDHSIDEGLAQALRAHPDCWASYPGWNFHGRVYATETGFACQVWTYGSPCETVVADDLRGIMDAVCDSYGRH